MSDDDLTPDDPFEAELGARLHGAADHVTGAGVTRAGVAAQVSARRRLRRSRAVLGAAAAALLIAVGVAAVVAGGDGGEQVHAGQGTTSVDPYAPPCGFVPTTTWAGWLAITPEQEAALRAAGEIAPGDEVSIGHAWPLSWRGYRALWGTPAEPTPELHHQLIDMDLTRLVDASWSGTITDEQRDEIASGVFPNLSWDQADSLMQDFGFDAVPPGGTSLGDQIPDFFSLVPTTTNPSATDPDATVSTVPEVGEPCPPGTPSSTSSSTTTTTEAPTTTAPKFADIRPPAGWPTQVRDSEMVEGEELWGVYLEILEGPGERDDGHGGVEYGEDVFYNLQHELYLDGYEVGLIPLACDQGSIQGAAAEQLEFPDDLSQVSLVSLYFRTREEAEDFEARYDGAPKAMVATQVTCVDQSPAGTTYRRG